MQKLFKSINDLGYYLLIIDMAMIPDDQEQLELEFNLDEAENSGDADDEKILYQ